MPAPQQHEAAVAFLIGELGDIRATVNAEQASLIAASAVTLARPGAGGFPRDAKSPGVSIEVERVDPVIRAVGVGARETDRVYDLHVAVRRKASASGSSQVETLEKVIRALERRYHNVSDLPVTGVDPNDYTTSWTLTGITVGTNTTAAGLLYARVTKDGGGAGIHRVALYKASGAGNSDLVARGDGANGATVTLTQQNTSGLSGSVVLGTVTASETTDAHYLRVWSGYEPGVNFVRSALVVREVESTPESGELARAVARLTLTFFESERSNAP